MITASATSRPHGGTRIRIVLLAGAGPVGVEHTTAVLDRLPSLACPVVVCLRDADAESLGSRPGAAVRWATDGTVVDEGRVWVTHPERQTIVRDGRFEVTEAGGDRPVGGPSLAKMYHSLRTGYGSRAFVVLSDPDRSDTPHLRLLAQRGATVVSTIECPACGLDVWPVARVVAHLEAEVGTCRGPVLA